MSLLRLKEIVYRSKQSLLRVNFNRIKMEGRQFTPNDSLMVANRQQSVIN
jgi:hypothetical protein